MATTDATYADEEPPGGDHPGADGHDPFDAAPPLDPDAGASLWDGDPDARPAAGVPRPRGEAAGDILSEREGEVLAFEKQWWRHAGAKEQAIRDRFGLSPTRYYQILNGLLDRPAALAADPVLVARLRRLRTSRSRARRSR
jgi:hypothetical protein